MKQLVALVLSLLLLASLATSQQRLSGGQRITGGVRVSSVAASDFITDSFTEASDTNLASHTPEVGSTWVDHTDSAYVDPISVIGAEDQIYKSSGSSGGMYYNDATPSSATYCCDAVMRTMSIVSANASICLRADTVANTMYIFQINNGTGWRARKIIAGAQTTIGTEDTTTNLPTVGSLRTMTACINGSSFTNSVDGVNLPTVGGTDTSITAAGKAGVRFNGTFTTTTGFHFVSFRCYPL